jgi:alkylhydroperoxidase family enzyme
MAYIELVQEADAKGILARVYKAARARAGGVANIIKLMSRDATSLEKSMQFYVSLMKSPKPLSSSRCEMLATVVSNVNDCYY